MTRRFTTTVALVLSLAVVAVGCGDDDTKDTGSSSTADSTTTSAPKATDCASALKDDGKLTVATGDPAFPPWVEDDKPEDAKGFEAALTYAIAEQLGIDAADVTWTRTGFDEAVAPGAKDYDFNIQQYSINADREKVVDFSSPYYDVQQVIVGRADGPISTAKTIADLKSVRLGAAIGTTSLDYIEQYIQPTAEAQVYDDNAAAKAAFDANQVDGIVFDLPTGYYITAVEIPDSKIVGILPQQGEAEQLGILFEQGSELTPCVNTALATLSGNGTLAELQEQWLSQGGDIPTLTK